MIKSQPGSAELDAWLAQHGARVLISVRDPRDAAVSMAQRFAAPLAHTVRWLVDDCNRLLRLPPYGSSLLRYEDRFFEDPATIKGLAYTLGLRPTPAIVAAIFARYRTDAVRAFAQTLTARPTGRVTMVGQFPMDPVTRILCHSKPRWSAYSDHSLIDMDMPDERDNCAELTLPLVSFVAVTTSRTV